MSNPTIGNESQFNAPFDILTNIIYTNPTTAASSQFNAPYDILSIGNPVKPNPTYINGNVSTYQKQFENANGRNTNSQNAVNWSAPKAKASNISLNSLAATATGVGAGVVAGLVGIPQVSQVAQSLIGLSNNIQDTPYSTLDYDQLKPLPGVLYADFRARRQLKSFTQLDTNNLINIRLDGTAAATRIGNNVTNKSFTAAAYAAASANPLGGAYAVFNLDGAGSTGYGWGSHGDRYAIRNDFTLRSHIATDWDTTAGWRLTKNIIERGVPFRGDRVNVIDRKQATTAGSNFKEIYAWKPRNPGPNSDGSILNNVYGSVIGELDTTQDFIKFFFSGPKLRNNSSEPDEVLVFRAIIGSLSDRFSPQWSETQMIGRADPNYHYTSFSREVDLDFTVYATSRDELKPIWRKLNALAGYTAPIYNPKNVTLSGPWMRITIGDLFHQQPVILNSLSYTLHDTDTTWEINIEKDSYIKQVPHKIEVNCSFYMISDFLPQKGGTFYSLSDNYDKNGLPVPGSDNWLSDFIGQSTSADGATSTGFGASKRDRSTQEVTTTPGPEIRNEVTGLDTSNSVFSI